MFGNHANLTLPLHYGILLFLSHPLILLLYFSSTLDFLFFPSQCSNVRSRRQSGPGAEIPSVPSLSFHSSPFSFLGNFWQRQQRDVAFSYSVLWSQDVSLSFSPCLFRSLSLTPSPSLAIFLPVSISLSLTFSPSFTFTLPFSFPLCLSPHRCPPPSLQLPASRSFYRLS